MLVSVNWIRDFIDISNQKDAKQLAEDFSLTTAEVDSVEIINEHFEKIFIVEVIEVRPHPNAEKLKLAKFKTGTGEIKEVVCGAPNVREGIFAAYAPVGVVLPNGLKLEARKIRGCLSEGMLCSEAELGIGEDQGGIFEADVNKAKVGMSLAKYFNITKDIILNIDNKSLTNRPDLWGHFGIAREFSAIYKSELKTFSKEWEASIENKLVNNSNSPITPKVDKNSSAICYYGVSIDGVVVEESPQWMQQRLLSCGVRPINNLVDIGNYVMLELGFPLHIFDRDKIKGSKLYIRPAQEGETLLALNGSLCKLNYKDTVIADQEKPLVIAGIIGGEESGVSGSTTKIFIEAANWEASKVRSTSNSLGIRTESSQRFEKSLDSYSVKQALLRAIELVFQLCPQAKAIGKIEYDGILSLPYKPTEINFSADKIGKLLGVSLSIEEIKEVLTRLQFEVSLNQESLYVKVPSFRSGKDINLVEDIAEEVGRLIGYNTIKPIAPNLSVKSVQLAKHLTFEGELSNYLAYRGRLSEVTSYPLTGEEELKSVQWHNLNEEIILKNPPSNLIDRPKPSLIPGGINLAFNNAKYLDSFGFFEIGRSYLPCKKTFVKEHREVFIALYSVDKNRFLELVNIVYGLRFALSLNVQLKAKEGSFNMLPNNWQGLHPVEKLKIFINGKECGIVNTLHPLFLQKHRLKGMLHIASIDFTQFINHTVEKRHKYKPIPKFPEAYFDCTVVAPKEAMAEEIINSVRALKEKEIEDVKVISVFEDKDKEKFLTISCKLLDKQGTIATERLKELENKIVMALNNTGYPLKAG